MKIAPWLLTTLLTGPLCAAEEPVYAAEEMVAPLGVSQAEPTGETVYERDAAGRTRVQREVRLDAQGNYVNHGVWRAWDADGRLTGQGRYAWGKPTGQWTRFAAAMESPQLREEPFTGFKAPYLSQATYRDGKLEGAWSIFDAKGKRISEVHFRDGLRHGPATLWSAAGEVVQRARFEAGRPTGTLEQLDAAGTLGVIATYENGREVLEKTEHYADGRLKSREQWLGGALRATEQDDPWRLRLARFEPADNELRHGLREAWWPNGQPKLRVEYRLGLAVGEARWWHENGQLALSGAYVDGLADGDWGWWREDGTRAAACRYAQGTLAGDWSLWAADGRRQDAHGARPEAGRLTQRPDALLVR